MSKFSCLNKINSPIEGLLDIADELTEWEYAFVMGISESGYMSEKQSDIVNKMVYDKIEVYL